MSIAASSISARDLKLAIAIAQKANVPLLIWGSVGISKTQQLRQYAADTNQKCFVLVGSHVDPTDVVGHYTVNFKSHETIQTKPRVYKLFEEEERGIIFIDEINNAPEEVLAVFLKLIDEGMLGEYRLSEGIFKVAAANPPELTPSGGSLPLSITTRFVNVYLKASMLDLKHYHRQTLQSKKDTRHIEVYQSAYDRSLEKYIFDLCIDYCLNNGLEPVEEDKRENEWDGTLTFRTLYYAAKIITVCLLNQHIVPRHIIDALTYGLIGKNTLLDFIHEKRLPTLKEILKNYDLIFECNREYYASLAYNLVAQLTASEIEQFILFVEYLYEKKEYVFIAAVGGAIGDLIDEKPDFVYNINAYNRLMEIFQKIKTKE